MPPSGPQCPSLESLRSVQLFRSLLFELLPYDNFDNLVKGMIVRCRLQDPNDQANDTDCIYRLAVIADVDEGTPYHCVAHGATETAKYLILEYPKDDIDPWPRETAPLNCISNELLKKDEYSYFAPYLVSSKDSILSQAAMRFRLQELKTMLSNNAKKLSEEQRLMVKEEVEKRCEKFPLVSSLDRLSTAEKHELEKKIIELLDDAQKAEETLSSCYVCHKEEPTVVCFPCLHKVLCIKCSKTINGKCPFPGCKMKVEEAVKTYAP